MPQETVLAFVDYENIRISLREGFLESVSIPELVSAIRQVAEEIGDLRAIRVYCDWTRRDHEARQFQEAGCTIVHVLRKRSGRDRTDIKMAFEIEDVTREQPDISACLIVAGDAHYWEPILRGTERGKKMHLSAVSTSTARELLGQVKGFYPLEGVLNLTTIEAAAPLLEVPLPEESLARFVQRVHGLEAGLPYVVRNYLRDTIMEDLVDCGETRQERDDFIERAIADGIIEPYEMPNPLIPGRNVTCVKLVKDNPIVTSILI